MLSGSSRTGPLVWNAMGLPSIAVAEIGDDARAPGGSTLWKNFENSRHKTKPSKIRSGQQLLTNSKSSLRFLNL